MNRSSVIRAERSHWPAPPAVVNAWRALAVARENVFVSPEWFGVWLTMHPRARPFVLVCRDEDAMVVGVLPLVISRHGPIRIVRFAGARLGDCYSAACQPADEMHVAEACAAVLAAHADEWHVLALDRLDREAAWPERLDEGWPGRGVHVSRWREHDVLPFVEFGSAGYDGYLASRSRHFRSSLRRYRRRLEERYSVRFRVTQSEHDLERDLDVLMRLHYARWDTRGGSTLRGGGERFHRKFARLALARGWLRLWTMELDGNPVAAWYGWRVGGRYCYSFSGFAPSYSDLQVGFLTVAHTIERAAAEGAAVYDMLLGGEPYKRRFETGRREAESVLVTRRGQPESGLIAAINSGRQGARRLPDPWRKQLRSVYRGAVSHGPRPKVPPAQRPDCGH